MDGPQVERMTINYKANSIIRLLLSLENRYYQRIMLPDLLIVLKTVPKIAVRRKNDESAASVLARSTEIWKFDWQQTPFQVIDANRSKTNVLSEIKSLVWAHL